jgi:FkbM family methyltransferase
MYSIPDKDISSYFRGALSLNMTIMRDYLGLRIMEIEPFESSPLYFSVGGKSYPLWLSADNVIGLSTFRDQSWDIRKIKFFQLISERIDSKICLVDIGANIGLFTRQFFSQIKKSHLAYCYEPQKFNFTLLDRNLSGLGIKTYLNNFAISDDSKPQTLFQDNENNGNFSLNISAMEDKKFTTSQVEVIAGSEEEKKWQANGLPIFMKIDTQGHDEKICTSFTLELWKQVKALSIEIWNIEKTGFDEDKFSEILDLFPYKVWENEPLKVVSTKEIMKMKVENNNRSEDLFCWK